MIQISLTNFRNVIDTKTYDFVKGELIHLTGKSGAGKSTILSAFEWGLYGKLAGVKPRSKRDLIPKVEIVTNSITIERDGNILNVKTSRGRKLTSDAAQGYIFLTFGDKDLWKSCSYLEQGYRNTLLIGSGEEKLKILRDLTYGYGIGQDEDPDYYLTKIKEALKNALIKKKTAYAVYDSFHEEVTKSLEKYKTSDNKWENSCYEIDDLKEMIKLRTGDYKRFSAFYNTRNLQLKETRDLNKRLDKINIAIEDDDFMGEDLYSDKTKTIHESLKDLNITLDNIKLYDKIDEYIPYEIVSRDTLEDLVSQKGAYQKFKSDLLRYNLPSKTTVKDLKDIKEAIHIKELLEDLKAFDETKEYIVETEKFIKRSKITLSKLEKELDNRNFDEESYDKLNRLRVTLEKSISNFKKKRSYKCPSCKDLLFMNEKGNLDLLEDIDIDKLKKDLIRVENEMKDLKHIDKIAHNIKDLEEEIEESEKELTEAISGYDSDKHKTLKNTKTSKVTIPSKIGSNPKILDELILSFVERPDEDLIIKYHNGDSLMKLLGSSLDDSLEKHTMNNITSKSVKLKIISEEKELQRIKNKRSLEIKTISEKELLEEAIRKIEDTIGSESEDEDVLESLETELEDLRSLEIDFIRYTEMEDKMETLNKYEDEVDANNKSLNALEVLYEHFRKLSVEPIEKIIECINFRLNEHLEEVFSEDNIRVILSLFKQSSGSKKDAFTKISVNLQVYHGDNSYPNISSLSGGEADRVSLALTLTLAEIFKPPVLFLDECMASLDSNLREICLKAIKDTTLITGSASIDICHESVEGYHDTVIKISN